MCVCVEGGRGGESALLSDFKRRVTNHHSFKGRYFQAGRYFRNSTVTQTSIQKIQKVTSAST